MMQIKSSSVLALAMLLLFTGCSGGKDKKAAIEAINKGMRKEALSLRLLLGRVNPKCAPTVHASDNQDLATVPEYLAAEKGGMISITPDGPGFWKADPVNPPPALAEFLKKAHRFGTNGCDYTPLTYPVAEKSVSEITLHQISSEKAEAEFTWKWTSRRLGARMVIISTRNSVRKSTTN